MLLLSGVASADAQVERREILRDTQHRKHRGRPHRFRRAGRKTADPSRTISCSYESIATCRSTGRRRPRPSPGGDGDRIGRGFRNGESRHGGNRPAGRPPQSRAHATGAPQARRPRVPTCGARDAPGGKDRAAPRFRQASRETPLSRSSDGKAAAAATVGHDVARLARVGLELLAKAIDVLGNSARRLPSWARKPDVIQELVGSCDPTRHAGRVGDEIELTVGQMDPTARRRRRSDLACRSPGHRRPAPSTSLPSRALPEVA